MGTERTLAAAQMGSIRALMLAELEEQRESLRRLQRLSFCLSDDPEDLDVRRDLAAILCRRGSLMRTLAAGALPATGSLPSIRPAGEKEFISSADLLDQPGGHT